MVAITPDPKIPFFGLHYASADARKPSVWPICYLKPRRRAISTCTISISGRRNKDKHLDVCQNCLDRLNYKGFQLGMRTDVRRAAVQDFSIADFFSIYPKTLHHSTPSFTDQTAPTNDYSADFALISRAYRQKQNWVCESCGISLSKIIMRRYLHVHHINGLKKSKSGRKLEGCMYPLSRHGAIAWPCHGDASISGI